MVGESSLLSSKLSNSRLGAFTDDLPFNLGQTSKEADDEAAAGCGRIQTLLYADEPNLISVKQFDEFEDVLLRPG